MALTKIVSGGQTGVDRGALDEALVAGFACGEWCARIALLRMERFRIGIHSSHCRPYALGVIGAVISNL
jgi:Circularly permutated YpsA SLOG family